MRILLAEDDEILLDGISKALTQSGYTVDIVSDGVDADAALRGNGFDLAILDLGLPRMDGLDVLRSLRSRGSRIPVLVLTARSGLEDRVEGLYLGADDYLAKPFDLPELEARVKALIRRSKFLADNEIVFGALRFNVMTRSLVANDENIVLSSREMFVMEHLLQRAGSFVSKDELLDKLTGWQNDISHNAIEVYIHRVRKRIEPFGVNIRAMRGLGYVLEMQR